jgi:hypothetical protein
MRRSWLEQMEGRTVLLHLKDSDSIEGILIRVYKDRDDGVAGVALRHGRMLKPGGVAATEMAGETFVPKGQVILVQHIR